MQVTISPGAISGTVTANPSKSDCRKLEGVSIYGKRSGYLCCHLGSFYVVYVNVDLHLGHLDLYCLVDVIVN